jgi:hypothetical protein
LRRRRQNRADFHFRFGAQIFQKIEVFWVFHRHRQRVAFDEKRRSFAARLHIVGHQTFSVGVGRGIA